MEMVSENEIPLACSICHFALIQPKKSKKIAHPKCIKIHKRFDKAFQHLTECQYDLVMLCKE